MVVIVLAGQRVGQVNALAEAFGVSHKCLVPIAGRPLVAHVLKAVAATAGVSQVRIVVEPEMFADIRRIADGIAGELEVEYVSAAANLADSVAAGMLGVAGPAIVTTADNVNLSPAAIAAMGRTLAGGADVAIAMARKEMVLAAHPEGQRRFYRFRDGEFSNCNLYALGGPKALKAAEAFRGGGQFAKSAKRIVDAFGFWNLLLFASGLLTLDAAMRRIGRRFGLTLAPVILADGRHAIDVDNERTYRVSEELLMARGEPAVASTPARSESVPRVQAFAL